MTTCPAFCFRFAEVWCVTNYVRSVSCCSSCKREWYLGELSHNREISTFSSSYFPLELLGQKLSRSVPITLLRQLPAHNIRKFLWPAVWRFCPRGRPMLIYLLLLHTVSLLHTLVQRAGEASPIAWSLRGETLLVPRCNILAWTSGPFAYIVPI